MKLVEVEPMLLESLVWQRMLRRLGYPVSAISLRLAKSTRMRGGSALRLPPDAAVLTVILQTQGEEFGLGVGLWLGTRDEFAERWLEAVALWVAGSEEEVSRICQLSVAHTMAEALLAKLSGRGLLPGAYRAEFVETPAPLAKRDVH